MKGKDIRQPETVKKRHVKETLTRQRFSPSGMVHEHYEAINSSEQQLVDNQQVPLHMIRIFIAVDE